MSLRYALLGLLADEPASGYDLTKKFERLLQRYAWHAQHSQVYPELTRLAADRLVEVAAEGPRGRRTYAITDLGREDLRRWMLNPPEFFSVRNEFVLRLFLLSTLEPEQAKALLRLVAEANDKELKELTDRVRQFDANAGPGAAPSMQRMVAEFGLRSFQLMVDWARWAHDHIDDAAAAGKPARNRAKRTTARAKRPGPRTAPAR
ncbi:MAG: PadR family transcriptional regulator [Micromonosporaceae bacterium]|nr:PadR family transcriptional regulator [Micromonosporaceae bacterium]